MFGQPRFADMNAHLNEILNRKQVLISAHRGSSGGSIAVNTTMGVKAAFASGADVVEIDVTASNDGEFFCFHDGCETELLGIEPNLQTLSAAEIDHLSHIWVDRPGRHAPVEHLLPLLRQFKDTDAAFIVDRSWWRWPNLLLALDGLFMAHQLIIKCPAWEHSAIQRLREFRVKFPFLPICQTPDDVYRVVNDPDLNTIGVELITNTMQSPWFSPSVIQEFQQLGVFCLVNTVTLNTGVPLFGGLDDEKAIRTSPYEVYSSILDLGVDAIQTDWPGLVKDARARWLANSVG